MISTQEPFHFFNHREPFAHTYSILARDEKTGDLAVAAQSHWFSVATALPWAEAGVGLIATQAFTNKSFGPRGLELLREGKKPQEVLEKLLATDMAPQIRQLAILNAEGQSAVHTGRECIDFAGHQTGKNFAVQANMMENPHVWPAMAQAFEKHASLPLPERMIRCLEAAEKKGGDLRGRQSAVLLVVKGQKSEEPWNDVSVDLRVDDHEEPVAELRRLLRTHRAYELMNKGDIALAEGKLLKARECYLKAEEILPANLEIKYWHAINLANKGQIPEACRALQQIYRINSSWRELTRRLPKAGLLNVKNQQLNQLL